MSESQQLVRTTTEYTSRLERGNDLQVGWVEKLDTNLTQIKSNPQNVVHSVDQRKKKYMHRQLKLQTNDFH